MLRRSRVNRGFSLIELLVAIAIIGIIAAIVFAVLTGTKHKGNDAKVKAEVSQIKTSLHGFAASYGGYPYAVADGSNGQTQDSEDKKNFWCIGADDCSIANEPYTNNTSIATAWTGNKAIFPPFPNNIEYKDTENPPNVNKGYIYVSCTVPDSTGQYCSLDPQTPEETAYVIYPQTDAEEVFIVGTFEDATCNPELTQCQSTQSLGGGSGIIGGGGGGGGVIYAWQAVGPIGFSDDSVSNVSIAISPDQTPYIGFRDDANAGKVSVKKWNGTDWENVGDPGFSAGTVNNGLSLAFLNSTPYVAYADDANAGKVSVKKWDGSNWVDVGAPGFSAGVAYEIKMAMLNGTPYVVYGDSTNNSATVKKWNGTSWVGVGGPATAEQPAGGYSIVMLNNAPYITYTDNLSGVKAHVRKFNGSSWENVGGPVSAGRADFPMIAVANSTLYVTYSDAQTGYKITVKKWNGTNWENVGTAGFSAGVAAQTNIVTLNNILYVAYKDSQIGQRVTVKKWNGTDWENVGDPGFSAGASSYLSLAISSDGMPYVGYSDSTYFQRLVVMKYDVAPPEEP